MPIKFNVKTRILVNGKEYSSPDEMPEDVRVKHEQALANRGSTNVQMKSSSKITFNGQTFNSPDEMPSDMRRIYDSVMASVDHSHDGSQDALQTSSQIPTTSPSSTTTKQDSAIAPSRVDGRLVIAGIVVLLAVMVLGALILILLSSGM